MNDNNKNTLMPANTIYGKVIFGNYSFFIAIFIAYLFSEVPWEKLYELNWYKNFIDVMSLVSLNIRDVFNTKNPFPKYSIAFISFINAIGPFYGLLSVYFGIKHMSIIRNTQFDKRVVPLPNNKLISMLIALLLALAIVLWGAFIYTGESSILPGIHFGSKFSFVGLYTFAWFAASVLAFMATCVVYILINSLNINK